MPDKTLFKIVMAASEAVPYAKTGGLADMVTALSITLSRMGHQIVVFLPLYGQMDKTVLQATGHVINVPVSTQQEKATLFLHESEGIRFYFIQSNRYFERAGLYGENGKDYPDNAARFTFFSRAILEAVKTLRLQPDIFHCHDWHTALIPVYLKTLYAKDFPGSASLFTIHNLGYQGIFWHYDWHLLNLPWSYFQHQALECYGKINFLKGGLVFSDGISTVSPRYAKEIQTVSYGNQLEGVLIQRRKHLTGILNGIDTQEWDPTTDQYIPFRYHYKNLSGKEKCKEALQKEVSLSVQKKRPLFVMVSRLSEQKGIDLLIAAFRKLMARKAQLIVMGMGDEKYERELLHLAALYPGQAAVQITYNNPMAHKIEAGGDLFLMPSQYEPCGLSQMMSLRYGTVPIVRSVGGLDDTITSFDPTSLSGNGFKFRQYTPTALFRQVQKSLSLFEEKKKWNVLVQNGMQGDYSWGASAEKYAQLYATLVRKNQKT